MILDKFEPNLNEAISDLTSQQRQDLAEAIDRPNVAIEWFDEPDVCAKALPFDLHCGNFERHEVHEAQGQRPEVPEPLCP